MNSLDATQSPADRPGKAHLARLPDELDCFIRANNEFWFKIAQARSRPAYSRSPRNAAARAP